MKSNLVIIGASGHGKVVADIAKAMNRWESISFLDDDESITSILGIKVVGKATDYSQYKEGYDVFVAIGNNQIREILLEKLEEIGTSVPVLVHPSAIIGSEVEIEFGTVVMPGTIINSGAKIGKGCIINTGASLDHDNTIEDFVHISPGVKLAGTVLVKENTWLGIGSIVSNNVSIQKNCKIGAGAVVVKDLTESGTYVGTPARKIDGE
ncbi:acetyltransferase [Halobacillus sp. B23F22_1]|uniref:acetyltransferase n=1 Tax=Halobacillus sp. B23F22_1 TaxID=3459514 RepID=UPI00373E5B5F